MRTLVLLVNLGTPNSPNAQDVRKYLAEFLSDPRVVELPRWLWLPLLYCFVLPLRSSTSSHAYQKIWTEQGSPLRVLTRELAKSLQAVLTDCDVQITMRYGNPSISEVLNHYRDRYDRLCVIPLYPQYASSSTGSALAKIMSIISTWRNIPSLHCLNQYYQHPLYIAAITQSIRRFWAAHGRSEKLLFSYHGIPQRSITLGEAYLEQCQTTTQAIAEALALTEDQYQLVFQSRFGKAKWLEPFCDKTLQALARSGITSVDVVCPGFAVDCLETLEEIALRNRDFFLEAGGKVYRYIPCLNQDPAQIFLLKELVNSCAT